MKKLISLSVLTVILAMGSFVLNSCSEQKEEKIDLPLYTGDNIDQAAIMNQVFTSDDSDLKCGGGFPEICGEVKFYPLIASQYYYAGALMVYNDDENLYVTYWSGWWLKLTDFHLYVGTAEGIPYTQSGNPKFGHFPYKDEESVTGFKTFVIPLSEVPECYTLIAHAVLGCHTVLAYGGNMFDGSRWGWTIEDCVEVCDQDNYYTLKFWFNDQNGDVFYAVPEATEQYYHEGDWCDEMGVFQLMEEQTLNLVRWSEKIGEVNISIENDLIRSIVTLNAGYTPKYAFIFYGQLAELDSYGACPNYALFPYYFEGSNALDFSIPLN